MEIKEIKDDKSKYMNLLLEEDPDKDVIEKYIKESDRYVLIDNDEIVACYL